MCANVELMFYGYFCTGMEVGCAGSVRGGPTHVAGYKHTLGHAPEEELGATSAMQVLCPLSEWVKWGSEGEFWEDSCCRDRRPTMRTTCLRYRPALDIGRCAIWRTCFRPLVINAALNIA